MKKGGILDGPTLFSSESGLSIGGEAGTEAVLPLMQLSSGELGVRAAGVGGGAPVIINLDLRGSNGNAEIERAVRRGIARSAPFIMNAAVNKVIDSRRRNPRLFTGSQI